MTDCPPWQDISTLTRNICVCERTVDAWVKQGLLPPPRMVGSKRLWRWKTVEQYLEGTHENAPESEALAAKVRNATRAAIQGDRPRNVRIGDPGVHDEREVPGLGTSNAG